MPDGGIGKSPRGHSGHPTVTRTVIEETRCDQHVDRSAMDSQDEYGELVLQRRYSGISAFSQTRLAPARAARYRPSVPSQNGTAGPPSVSFRPCHALHWPFTRARRRSLPSSSRTRPGSSSDYLNSEQDCGQAGQESRQTEQEDAHTGRAIRSSHNALLSRETTPLNRLQRH